MVAQEDYVRVAGWKMFYEFFLSREISLRGMEKGTRKRARGPAEGETVASGQGVADILSLHHENDHLRHIGCVVSDPFDAF